MVIVGVGIGVGIAHALQDRIPARTASAASEGVSTVDGRTAALAPPTTAAPIEPAVMRFAWASTCDVAITGVSDGGVDEIRRAFQVAHDQAALFEEGIVPDDVDTVLGDAYASIVGGQREAGAGARLGDQIRRACGAWADRIDAGR